MNKKRLFILVLPFILLCGCVRNMQCEPKEYPHLYWKDIDVVIENVEKKRWFACTIHYIVSVTVKSDEYQLVYTDEFVGTGAFGCPKQWNYNNGDVVKAKLYSWVMDSTGEVVRREIHEVY